MAFSRQLSLTLEILWMAPVSTLYALCLNLARLWLDGVRQGQNPRLFFFFYDFKLMAFMAFKWINRGFPGGASGKESTCWCRKCKRCRLIPGSGRSPGERNGNMLQYSCLGNHMNRGAWQSPRGHKELDMTERLTEQLSNKNQIYIGDDSHQAIPSHTQWIN